MAPSIIRATGRKDFQARFIKRSKRYRGNVVRSQIQTPTVKAILAQLTSLFRLATKNTLTNITDMNKILAYSAMKIKANPTAPYSMLNPETSSDSPSAKSNGVRLVSATQEMSQSPAKGGKINTLTQDVFDVIKVCKDNVLPKNKKNKKIKARLTS